MVEALCSSVSPGTERLVAMGRIPRELSQEMRCPHMGGSFSFPIKYGYSLVGRVVEGPDSLRGRLVHALHPHQSLCVLPIGDVFEIPEGVTPRRATLASTTLALAAKVARCLSSASSSSERPLRSSGPIRPSGSRRVMVSGENSRNDRQRSVAHSRASCRMGS